jgi:hypothetical protein
MLEVVVAFLGTVTNWQVMRESTRASMQSYATGGCLLRMLQQELSSTHAYIPVAVHDWRSQRG